jgi:hypothetical protein
VGLNEKGNPGRDSFSFLSRHSFYATFLKTMAKNIHKGTELNNVKETWNENEKKQVNTTGPSTGNERLDRVIKEESAEYDSANKEERLLTGDRGSVKDEDALGE